MELPLTPEHLPNIPCLFALLVARAACLSDSPPAIVWGPLFSNKRIGIAAPIPDFSQVSHYRLRLLLRGGSGGSLPLKAPFIIRRNLPSLSSE